jgi:hypothetical protein
MRNLNAFIGALALASCFVMGIRVPGGGVILAAGLGLALPLFLIIQFIIDLKDKNGSWILNFITSFGMLTFGYGSLFKIMHWPGSGLLLTGALFLFFPLAILIAVFKGFGASQNKLARVLAGFGGYTLSMSILFKIMHWPGGDFIQMVNFITMSLGLVSLAILWKNSEKSSSILNTGFILKSLFIPILLMTMFLGLRVSKSILDSFVAIEDNVQKSSIVHLDRGNSFKNEMQAGYASNKESNKSKAAKIKYYSDKIDSIDKQTAQLIEFIDQVKLYILEKSGETLNSTGRTVFGDGYGNTKSIDWSKVEDFEKNKLSFGVEGTMKDVLIHKKYNNNDPLRPSRINSIAIIAKDQYDVPMHEIIGEDISKPDPNKYGMKLWKMLTDYRTNIVETIASSHEKIDSLTGKGIGELKYSLKATPINHFRDNIDLDMKVRAMLAKSNISEEDMEVIKQVYMELTKQERFEEVNDVKNVHWIGVTFDHSPLVAALASLTTLQSEILNARATAVGHLRSKVSLRD